MRVRLSVYGPPAPEIGDILSLYGLAGIGTGTKPALEGPRGHSACRPLYEFILPLGYDEMKATVNLLNDPARDPKNAVRDFTNPRYMGFDGNIPKIRDLQLKLQELDLHDIRNGRFFLRDGIHLELVNEDDSGRPSYAV